MSVPFIQTGIKLNPVHYFFKYHEKKTFFDFLIITGSFHYKVYNFVWCRTLPVPTVCRGELSPNGRFILKNNPYLSNFHAAAHHKNKVLNNPLYKGRTLGSRNIHTQPSIVFAYSTEPVKCKDVPGTAAELSASGNPNPDSSFGCFLVPKCFLKFYIQ